jgi:hypothetical protein
MSFATMARYHAHATNRVARVGMNYLSDLIIRPGIEKMFGPLLLYRGQMNRGHAHRLWNMSLLMMASECETLSDGLKVLNNPDFAQLCGPLRPPNKMTLFNFFGRLNENPAVAQNIEGLTEYARLIGPHETALTRVDRFTYAKRCAEWRISLNPNKHDPPRERGIPRKEELFYPYLAHDPKKPDEGQALVLLVNKAVPKGWPDSVRADVCQDLIVSILSGEIRRDEVDESVQRYIRQHFKTLPMRWEGDRTRTSIDAPLPGAEDLTLHDLLSDGSYEHWAEDADA